MSRYECKFGHNYGLCGFIECVADEVCKCTKNTMNSDIPIITTTFPLKLFVYGTLKRGHGNNHYLQRCKFLKVAGVYGILLHLGHYPGLLMETTGGLVNGELWEIPDKDALDGLDRLEGHPTFYTRQNIRLAGGEEAWTYVYTTYNSECMKGRRSGYNIILSGVWTGSQADKVPFHGYYLKRFPEKTEGPGVAHLTIPGEFAGLVDTFGGVVLRDYGPGGGKPRFVYNITTKTWDLAKIQPVATIPYNPAPRIEPPKEVKEAETWTPYIDDSDPGEIDAPRRPIEVKVA